MSEERIKGKERLKPLGIHTAVGHLHELEKWKDIPYLKDNEGMLPPFMIAVGSRVRVKKAVYVLGMKNPIFLDEEALARFGLEAYGRISMLIGVVEHDGFPVPLSVVETQMGCPATQINLKEALYFTREDGYNLNGRWIKSNGIYVVRAGTCGGVNSFSPSKAKVSIGDIVIANESYGLVGAIMQSALSKLSFAGIDLMEAVAENQGLSISNDRRYLKTECSKELIEYLKKAAKSLGLDNIVVGPNFTKDSLYAEMGEEEFAKLRDDYGIVSTEMEEMMIDVIASEFRREGITVHSGLVIAAVGAIPGKSFAETEEEKKAASEAENNTLRIAARTFGEIAKLLNRK